MDYIQHGARAGVWRFTPRRGRSVVPLRPFYAENAAAGSSTHLVYWKNLYASSAFAWGVFAGYWTVLHGARRLRPSAGESRLKMIFRGPFCTTRWAAALNAPSFNSIYIVTPVQMYLTLPQGISSCTALLVKRRILPHLDLEHIPETIHAGYDALILGIYAAEWSCIAVGLATQEPV